MKTVVFFGGKSCEHDISIITACGLGGALADAAKIYIDQNNKWWYVKKTLTPREYKGRKMFPAFVPVVLLPNDRRVFAKFGIFLFPLFAVSEAVLCFHGVNGEDGSVQGLLQLAGVPHTCSGVAASAIGMDKMLSKRLFRSLELPVLPAALVTKQSYDSDGVVLGPELTFPLVIKPCSLGSSIGISVAGGAEELEKALSVAFAFDNSVLIEKALPDAREANCCYLCGEVSDVFRPVSSGEILSFGDKYLSGEKHEPPRETVFVEEIKEAASRVCNALGINGCARVDFLVNGEAWYINEINTIPGSLGYTLWKDVYTLGEYMNKLICDARAVAGQKEKLVFTYDSEVLSGGRAKK